MKRASLLALVLMIFMVVGALLVPGPAWAGGHCRRHHRSRYHTSYHRTAYYSARRYVGYEDDYSYRRCERPRYTRYYDDYDEGYGGYCPPPRYYAYDAGYGGYCPPRRSSFALFVSLGGVFGGHHRRFR